MSQKMKFPHGGYDVNVVRKQEVLDCIDDNIIDKEIALDVIKQLEIDVSTSINNGKWTGIPFIGNVRVPRYRQILQSEKTKILKSVASERLDKERYILFRKNLAADVRKRESIERYFSYRLARAMNKNMQVFKELSKRRGELEAKILILSCFEMRDMDYEINHYGKQQVDNR